MEIEDLYAQMVLLKKEVRIQMPCNTRYVNDYIEGTWQHVTALTSAIERYDAPAPWLEEKFADYAKSQEKLLEERLEIIKYSIDALDTVLSVVLRGTRIEEVGGMSFFCALCAPHTLSSQSSHCWHCF